ncbi:hypothetical protein BBP40_001641 [Aspergillus hancockii]|nr:hypothetical protein BBP40_001641 [Aspergillus hancockii]
MKLLSPVSTIFMMAPLALARMQQIGCYSSSGSLKSQGSYTYQSLGYCEEYCLKKDKKFIGLHDGTECWCGDSMPDKEDLVSDDKCDTPCSGWPGTMCGSANAWSVWQVDAGEVTVDSSSTSTEASTDPSSTTAPRSTITSGAQLAEQKSSSASPSASASVSATRSEKASQSATSSAASSITSTSAASRRFKVLFFL